MKTWLCPILSMSGPDNNLTRNRNAETSAGVHEIPSAHCDTILLTFETHHRYVRLCSRSQQLAPASPVASCV